MKILVTGSSGTVGTHLCERLLEEGHDVVGADWKENKWSSKVQQVTVNVDLRDKEKSLKVLPKDVDVVIHLAANARVYDLVVDPQLAFDNFQTLFTSLEFARLNNIKKFMFSSSREVYGNSEKAVHHEDEARIKNCESAYTASKIGGEALIHAYQQCYGIDFVIFRYSNVYGRYDVSDRVIPIFIRQCFDGQDLTVFGKEKFLDFTYIEDAINGTINLLENFDGVKNEVYNLATGHGSSLTELAEIVQKIVGSNNRVLLEESRTGEVVKYVADISKIQKVTDYSPKTILKEGVVAAVEWYEKNVKDK